MADPKIFTGEEYTFTLYESDVRPGVIVRHKQAPLDHGQWISLSDLLAFVAWRNPQPGHETYIDEPGTDFPPGTRVHVIPTLRDPVCPLCASRHPLPATSRPEGGCAVCGQCLCECDELDDLSTEELKP